MAMLLTQVLHLGAIINQVMEEKEVLGVYMNILKLKPLVGGNR
jgi:hypothetical protein